MDFDKQLHLTTLRHRVYIYVHETLLFILLTNAERWRILQYNWRITGKRFSIHGTSLIGIDDVFLVEACQDRLADASWFYWSMRDQLPRV